MGDGRGGRLICPESKPKMGSEPAVRVAGAGIPMC